MSEMPRSKAKPISIYNLVCNLSPEAKLDIKSGVYLVTNYIAILICQAINIIQYNTLILLSHKTIKMCIYL